jgi:hypothetical protein
MKRITNEFFNTPVTASNYPLVRSKFETFHGRDKLKAESIKKHWYMTAHMQLVTSVTLIWRTVCCGIYVIGWAYKWNKIAIDKLNCERNPKKEEKLKYRRKDRQLQGILSDGKAILYNPKRISIYSVLTIITALITYTYLQCNIDEVNLLLNSKILCGKTHNLYTHELYCVSHYTLCLYLELESCPPFRPESLHCCTYTVVICSNQCRFPLL